MSRKYRQQGYMDSDRDDARSRPAPPPANNLTPEERIQRRSLRHAMEREAREVVRCHGCGRSVQSFDAPIDHTTVCPSCNAPLHCCRGCSHFDTGRRWQCRAEISQPVADKSKANDCPSYAPRLVLDSTGRRSDAPRGNGDPREQFENLFKR